MPFAIMWKCRERQQNEEQKQKANVFNCFKTLTFSEKSEVAKRSNGRNVRQNGA